jgi:aryl-alcohol dehydrogenase-like predicted oxidoreductase
VDVPRPLALRRAILFRIHRTAMNSDSTPSAASPGHPTHLTRRSFIKSTVAAGIAAGLSSQPLFSWAEEVQGIPYVTLGSTGVKVSHIGLGGYHVGTQLIEAESIKIVRTAIDAGINFMDNCWDYNNGSSEVRMGKALRDGYRDKVFLMTKIDGRTKAAAAAQIDQSLQRLQVSHVDLMQFHEIIRMTDPDRIFAEGSAYEAMIEAKKAGKVRFIGFTGHKSPEIHLKMLATAADHGLKFDAVQMPINVMDAHYDSFAGKVLPKLREAGIGSLGMKPLGGAVILHSKTVTPIECLQYALSQPVDVVITGCDSMDILNQALTLARNFKPLTHDQQAAILARTAPVADAGKYELYKTTIDFDGTTRNPQYLG